MRIDHETDPGAEGVLQQAGQMDALVATCLRDAVAQLQVLSAEVLKHASDLQQWAAMPDAPAGLAEALQPQLGSLLRVGQFHDIFGQAAERCLQIQDRRAGMVAALVAALQDQGPQVPDVLRGSIDLLQACRDEQARHAFLPATQAGAVELF